MQPSFDALGDLYFISDRSGWWNLYRQSSEGKVWHTSSSLEGRQFENLQDPPMFLWSHNCFVNTAMLDQS